MFDKSFDVIVDDKLLNKPPIPLLIVLYLMFPFISNSLAICVILIAFLKSAKLLLNIPILFIAPFKSVVIVLNILLINYKYCGHICYKLSYVE